MFPGMFQRKPDKAAALKQLKSHVAMFGAWAVVIRLTPYVLHYFSDHNEELKLELWFFLISRAYLRYLDRIFSSILGLINTASLNVQETLSISDSVAFLFPEWLFVMFSTIICDF